MANIVAIHAGSISAANAERYTDERRFDDNSGGSGAAGSNSEALRNMLTESTNSEEIELPDPKSWQQRLFFADGTGSFQHGRDIVIALYHLRHHNVDRMLHP
jgi:hypothetical protein